MESSEVMRSPGARDAGGLPIAFSADPVPRPEFAPAMAVFPPVMKIPSGPWPPPLIPGAAPAPLLAAFPPGAPGRGPSGEMEIRAERFPAVIAGGGAGAGVAESAIKVELSDVRLVISGAAASRSPRCADACGADIGLTGRSGLDGACLEEAMLIAPECCSNAGTSGAEVSTSVRCAGVMGRMTVRLSFGRIGWESASCTMLGSAGKILGGSCCDAG